MGTSCICGKGNPWSKLRDSLNGPSSGTAHTRHKNRAATERKPKKRGASVSTPTPRAPEETLCDQRNVRLLTTSNINETTGSALILHTDEDCTVTGTSSTTTCRQASSSCQILLAPCSQKQPSITFATSSPLYLSLSSDGTSANWLKSTSNDLRSCPRTPVSQGPRALVKRAVSRDLFFVNASRGGMLETHIFVWRVVDRLQCLTVSQHLTAPVVPSDLLVSTNL